MHIDNHDTPWIKPIMPKLVDYFSNLQKKVAAPVPPPPADLTPAALAEIHMLRVVLVDRGIVPPRLSRELEVAYYEKYTDPKKGDPRSHFSVAELVELDAHLLSKGNRPP